MTTLPEQFEMQKGANFQFDLNQQTINIELGWETESRPKKLDLDVSCVILDKDSELLDAVYYNRLETLGGSIKHSGDNRSGNGAGDNELITVLLNKLPKEVDTLIFIINMFSPGKSFQDVKSAYCRVFEEQGEICRYNIKDFNESEGLILAQVYKKQSRWIIQALGIPVTGRTFKESFYQNKKAFLAGQCLSLAESQYFIIKVISGFLSCLLKMVLTIVRIILWICLLIILVGIVF
eukprot:GHVP01056281.1.p1 GENE.GHVP01056281.1~~GHVP01056281.1.p1  ORF type:complete len:236 (+),score=29.32 GHVP01056281.1:480-1187(+)